MHLVNGTYHIGEVPVMDLIDTYDTPLYVYDGEKIRSQYKRLTDAFKKTNAKFKYACKANTNLEIIRLLKSVGCGLDTVSIQEVLLGMKAGYAPEEILYTPNCVSFDEIKKGVEAGVKINIDNISILEQFGHEYGNKVPICLRITPHLVGGGNIHIQTGHIDSKFGISIHQMRHALRVIQTNNIVVEGIHMHTGSDILDAQVFLNGLEILLEQAKQFKDLKYIDCGSGFKVPYRVDDVETNIERLGEMVSNRFNEFCKEYGRDLELWFEPGKYLVSESGYFLTRVNVIKQTVASTFAGVDSGFNHLIRPKLYDAYHFITNASNPNGVPRVYTVVGYICETDTFAVDRKLHEVREGDILVFHNAGAYCYVMSSNYNSRFKPAEVLVDGNKHHLIRKRDDIESLLHNQVEIKQESPA